MKLTLEQVEHIADLAHLDVSDKEKAVFRKQLSSILEYVETLSGVDTSKTDPLYHSVALQNVMRPDDVSACDAESRRRLIGEFPEKEGDLLKVPAVFS